jgi:ketosteroid isomerase-like protein
MTSAQSLAESVFKTVDAMQPEAFAQFLAEDGAFIFGNMPAAKGRAAVAGAVKQFFSSISGIKHHIAGVWQEGDTVTVELEVSYTRKDGKVVTLPCANIWKLNQQDKISDYRIFMDVNPVFA